VPEQLAAALADRYRIERELGEGGMATVFLAEDLRHHRKVAIKVLRPELASGAAPQGSSGPLGSLVQDCEIGIIREDPVALPASELTCQAEAHQGIHRDAGGGRGEAGLPPHPG